MASAVPIVSTLHVFRIVPIPRGPYSYPYHSHPFYQIQGFLRGRVTYHVEKAGRFNLKAGDCILLPPLFRHRYESREGFQDFSFKFDIAAVAYTTDYNGRFIGWMWGPCPNPWCAQIVAPGFPPASGSMLFSNTGDGTSRYSGAHARNLYAILGLNHHHPILRKNTTRRTE